MKLSIIIVNFNSGKYLKECLESIKKSTLSPNDYEVTIVDNDSTDSSLKQGLNVQFSSLHLVKNGKNVGFSKANNQGIKKSGGDYILLLNPDTLLQKNTLKIMIDYMDNNPNVGVSTCKLLLPDGSLDDACHRGFPTPWNAFCHFSGISSFFPKSKFLNGYHLGYSNLDKIHEIDSCVGAFMLIRKTVGESLGWLDEDYFWYGEDIDFCFRVKEKGSTVMFVPTTSIVHHKGISSGIKNHSKDISTADETTRLRASHSRFDVMRIFYKKHYQHRYPFLLTTLVLSGIRLKQLANKYANL